jgi:hypothetical protein
MTPLVSRISRGRVASMIALFSWIALGAAAAGAQQSGQGERP